MNAPFRWAFPTVAVAATLVALIADPNETIVIPAATIAVAAAGLALWDSVRPRTAAPGAVSTVPEPLSVSASDQWFRAGVVGQEAIVLLLDRIDRALLRPDLPSRELAELIQLRSLPREQFLKYLESRLAELEANS